MPRPHQTIWFRLSIDFYDHPKVFTIHIHERELYQRAICYCRRHMTDGLISRETLRQLGKPQVLDLCECLRRGRAWNEVCDEWIEVLAKCYLLDRIDDNFFQVHDFLDWNPSRSHLDSVSSSRRKAGRKGGNSKHLNQLEAKQNASKMPSKMLSKMLANDKQTSSTATNTNTLNSSLNSSLGDRQNLDSKFAPPTIEDVCDMLPKVTMIRLSAKRQALEDFTITEELRKWAREKHGVELSDEVLAEFKDHWRKEPDKKLRTDWTATFQMNVNKLVGWNVLKPSRDVKTATSPICQERVQRGSFLKPCGSPSVTVVKNRPLCKAHKEQYDQRTQASRTTA